MTKNLLVELGLEELPAYVVTSSAQQLKDKMADFLAAHRLSFEEIETFSTPRRLAVRVKGLADKQTDLSEDFKGPAKKIALDADGNFTKAAEGFVRGKGLTTADIRFETIKGEDYVYVTKQEVGQPVEHIVPQVTEVLTSLNFPVSMHWGSNTFSYIRPVHTLTILLDEQVIEVPFLDIQSSHISRGHRFLGHETTIGSALSYEADLREVFVIASAQEREQMIVDQIKALEAAHGVQVDIDADLLDEVLNLIEYPTAFLGRFDAKYLAVPEEVLVTSMKNHQRYFVVRDKEGQLLPHFVSVRNGNAQHIENVVKGNEKVLVARLEDGEFFWKEDQKLNIEDLVAKLANVTFHEKIGSLAEHMQRTAQVADLVADLADLTAAEKADLARAASIYKFDLLTGMVGEFDELQGIMGEKYARLAGENAAVAAAIREHYLPNSAEGDLPETKVGAVLAIADKLDTLLSFFAVGLIPSGSNDPYALRRATAGIVRILDAFGWQLDLAQVVEQLFALQFDSLVYANKAEVLSFIRARVDKLFDASISKDIREAVLAKDQLVVSDLLHTAQALATASHQANYKAAVESLSRVFNLAEKAEGAALVDPALFENDAEKALALAIDQLTLGEDVATNLDHLFALSPVIDAFFDHTMVMVEDAQIKANRLALLASLVAKAGQVAVFNLLNTK